MVFSYNLWLIIALVILFLTIISSILVILYYQKVLESKKGFKREKFKALSKKIRPGAVVFVGDSHTENFLVHDQFPSVNLVNRGISGDTAEELINRIETTVIDLEPSKVFLMIGTNDLYAKDSVEKIIKNIKVSLEKISKSLPDCLVYFWSIPPVADTRKLYNAPLSFFFRLVLRLTMDRNKKISEINNQLRYMAIKAKFNYIDIENILSDRDGFLRPQYTIEGLHLNVKAYLKIASRLNRYI